MHTINAFDLVAVAVVVASLVAKLCLCFAFALPDEKEQKTRKKKSAKIAGSMHKRSHERRDEQKKREYALAPIDLV